MQYFPLPTPRQSQEKSLLFVQDVVSKGYRDIVLEAPTGIGKTAIGATIAAWARDNVKVSAPNSTISPGAYILVQQKVLQDQIERELDRLAGTVKAALIKSSVEYQCPSFKRCSLGMMERRCECIGQGSCTYKNAKMRFMGAPVAVTNYAYFFTERLHVGQIPVREVLVLDECHHLSRLLLRFVDVVVSERTLEQFAPDIDPRDLRGIRTLDEFTSWAEDDYLPIVQQQAELLLALNDSDENAKEANEVQNHAMKVASFLERVAKGPEGWVFWQEEDRDHRVTLTARPMDAGPYFDELVGKNASLRVYMSAYPGPKTVFCRELGLDPQRVAWLRLKSPFAVEHRPIHILGAGSLAKQHQEANLPGALRLLVKIAKAHGDERGIVHTHSYQLADAAESAMRAAGLGNRLVYPEDADSRDEALRTHAAAPGAILISPSVGEGFDFRGDLARWQVILKCPWASLGDKHTEALATRDPEWYRSEAVKSLLQTCGRVCRSDDDHGATYILDEDVKRLLRDTRDQLPKWFKIALFTADGEPFFRE